MSFDPDNRPSSVDLSHLPSCVRQKEIECDYIRGATIIRVIFHRRKWNSEIVRDSLANATSYRACIK